MPLQPIVATTVAASPKQSTTTAIHCLHYLRTTATIAAIIATIITAIAVVTVVIIATAGLLRLRLATTFDFFSQ